MVDEGNKIGWDITLEHVASFEPMWYDPLTFKYRDNEIMGIHLRRSAVPSTRP